MKRTRTSELRKPTTYKVPLEVSDRAYEVVRKYGRSYGSFYGLIYNGHTLHADATDKLREKVEKIMLQETTNAKAN